MKRFRFRRAAQEINLVGSPPVPNVNVERLELVLRYALACTAHEEEYVSQWLGPIHLIKLAYLADLAHAERTGETYTGARWVFYKFGPWAQEVSQQIEPVAHGLGAEARRLPSEFGDEDFVRWHLNDEDQGLTRKLEAALPLEVASAIKRAVREFGSHTAGLLNHVYDTPPMRMAAPNDLLVFEQRVPEPPRVRPEPLTRKEAKNRRAMLAEARVHLRNAIEERRAAGASVAPPPYDELFWTGVGGSESSVADPGEVTLNARIDDEMWKARKRGDAD